MDVILKSYIEEMGFGYIEDYIRQLYSTRVSRDTLVRKLGVPEKTFLKS